MAIEGASGNQVGGDQGGDLASGPGSGPAPAQGLPADLSRDVVLVSNRGPLAFRIEGDELVPTDSGGGLAGALLPLVAGTGATWVAGALSAGDRRAAEEGRMRLDGLNLVTVDMDPQAYRMAYDVVANATLWFCHHHLFDLPRRPRLDRFWMEAWEAYRQFNHTFADVVAKVAPEGASVLVQDYHLALAGTRLAELRPDLRTAHFSHTPFADPGFLRVLPSAVVAELLAGMAAFDVCGFHTPRWERSYLDCQEQLGTAGPWPTLTVPLAPDPARLAEVAATPGSAAARKALAQQVGDRRLLVRVDRVELSKNLLRGFWAFEELLITRPQWRERVVFLAFAYPSRQGLAEYLAYLAEVEATVARINETWGTPDWTPIVLDLEDNRAASMAALAMYDVLVVNPVRDGLNLVAKEGPIVNQNDGVVALSTEAGAFTELEGAALTIDPFDVSGTAEVLARALDLPAAERRERAAELRRRVLAAPPQHWLSRQLGFLRTCR